MEGTPTVGACPGLVAHVQIHDYDGAHAAQLCVTPGGFNVNGGVVSLDMYDPTANGIFHNGFDVVN